LSRHFEKLQIKSGAQHHDPAALNSVILFSTNGTEHWVVPERLGTFREKIKCWHKLGFKPRSVHPLAQSIHPLRYAGFIQHWLQAY